MPEDFLVAAKRFGEPPRLLNPCDLGIALFLEYFAMPVVYWYKYVPLRQRPLLPDLTDEFRDWIAHLPLPAEATPDWNALATWARTAIDGSAQQQEFLDVIGQSFYRRMQRRRQEMHRANLVSGLVLIFAILVHITSVLGMVVATWWLLPFWLIALMFASLICWRDLHWKPKSTTESHTAPL